MDILYYLIGFISLLWVIVFIHEGGHFLAAKSLGISVTNFAVGMGRVVFSRTYNGVSYEIRLLPIGGFVKMLGDGDATSTTKKDIRDKSDKRYFANRTRLEKSWVIIAGPLANFILGMVIFTSVFFIYPHRQIEPIATTVVENSPAELGGMKVNDKIIEINGSTIYNMDDVRSMVSINLDAPMDILVLRDDTELELTITPEIIEIENLIGEMSKIGRIGIASDKVVFDTLPLGKAFLAGFNEFKKQTMTIFTVLGQIFEGKRDVKELGGPVKIAEVSGKALSIGFVTFMMIMASISINLGIMNLLPLPMLDGGHLLMYALEAVSGGKEIPPKTLEYAYKASAAFLLTVMLYVTFWDIQSVIERHF